MLYFTRNFNYFTKRGIRGPKPVVGIGNLWELMFTPVAELKIKRFKKYGKLYGVFEGNRPVLKVGDPALVKEILQRESDVFQTRRDVSNAKHPIVDLIIGKRGDEWRRMRSTASPKTTGQLRALYPLIRQSLTELLTTLTAHVTHNKGNTVDMNAWFERYAIDVLARTLFDTNTGAYTDPNDPFLVNARRVYRPPLWKIVVTLLVPTRVLNILNIKTETDDRAVDFWYEISQNLLKRRKQDEKSVGSGLKSTGHELLSDNELISQLFASLNGGFASVASALAFCCHELALNAHIQDRLHREVTDGLPPMDAIDHNNYDL
ncbi:unnamed protein product, partial [Medioppia subpectinata]